MMTIAAPYLEIAVLIFGMLILLLETFAAKINRTWIAYFGIAMLAFVLIASFFVAPHSSTETDGPFWKFYTADGLAMFFKRFELVATILVLIMMIDYAPAVQRASDHRASNLGEFFSLPLLTCAG